MEGRSHVYSQMMWLLPLLLVVSATSESSSTTLMASVTHECADKPLLISTSTAKTGLMQTPNFPHVFPLPLRCTWILDNSGIQHDFRLTIYFSQFYLRAGLVRLHVVDRVSYSRWASSNFSSGVLPGHALEADFQLKSSVDIDNEAYVVLSLDLAHVISLDKLHSRVIDVYDEFGFRVVYDVRKRDESRIADCSLFECHLNGKCRPQFSLINSEIRLSGFECECSTPNRAQIVDSRFVGETCSVHNDLRECTEDNRRQKCSDNGQCGYWSNRRVMCKCDDGFHGKFCHRTTNNTVDNIDDNAFDGNDDEEEDEEVFAKNVQNFAKPSCPIEFLAVRVQEEDNKGTQSVECLARFFVRNWPSLNAFYSDSTSELYLHASNDSRQDLDSALRVVKDEITREALKSRCGSHIGLRKPRLLHGIKAKTLVSKPELPVLEGDDFHLSCQVCGLERPDFSWRKERKLHVDTLVSRRSLVTDRQRDGLDVVGVLTVRNAAVFDAGHFTCLITDKVIANLRPIFNSRIEKQSLPFKTRDQVEIKVDMVVRPSLEVFPRSLTIRKDRIEPNARLETLHCLASKWSELGPLQLSRAKHLSFAWLRNGDKLGDHEFTEDVYEPFGAQGIAVIGQLLRLSNIKSSANYTCVVEDLRGRKFGGNKFSSSVSVEVHLAESRRQVCQSFVENEVVWPDTIENAEAIRPCMRPQIGLIRRRCERVNGHSVWAPTAEINFEQCVTHCLSSLRLNVSVFLDGYVSPSASSVASRVFGNACVGRRALHAAEWSLVLDMAKDVVKFLGSSTSSSSEISMESASLFYNDFLVSLMHPFASRQADLNRFLRVFELVRQASKLFASHLNLTNEVFPSANRGPTGLEVHLSAIIASNNPFNDTNKEPLSRLITSDKKVIRLKSNAKKRVKLAAVRFDQLDRVLANNNLTRAVDWRGDVYEKNSSALAIELGSSVSSVVVEYPQIVGNSKRKSNNEDENEDEDENEVGRICGRLHFNEENVWQWQLDACQFEVIEQKPTCICDQDGVIALFLLTDEFQSSLHRTSSGLILVSLCCGGCLSMTLVTLILQLRQVSNRLRCSQLSLQNISSSLLIVVVMLLLIVVLSEPKQQKAFWISLSLQISILALSTLQVMAPLMIAQKSLDQHVNLALKRGLGAIVTTFLLLLLIGHWSSTTSHWFVVWGEPDLSVFVVATITLDVAFVFAVLAARRGMQLDPDLLVAQRRSKRLLLLRSLLLSLSLLLFRISLLLYANTSDPKVEYLLALATIILGLVVFNAFLGSVGNNGGNGEAGANGDNPKFLRADKCGNNTREGRQAVENGLVLANEDNNDDNPLLEDNGQINKRSVDLGPNNHGEVGQNQRLSPPSLGSINEHNNDHISPKRRRCSLPPSPLNQHRRLIWPRAASFAPLATFDDKTADDEYVDNNEEENCDNNYKEKKKEPKEIEGYNNSSKSLFKRPLPLDQILSEVRVDSSLSSQPYLSMRSAKSALNWPRTRQGSIGESSAPSSEQGSTDEAMFATNESSPTGSVVLSFVNARSN